MVADRTHVLEGKIQLFQLNGKHCVDMQRVPNVCECSVCIGCLSPTCIDARRIATNGCRRRHSHRALISLKHRRHCTWKRNKRLGSEWATHSVDAKHHFAIERESTDNATNTYRHRVAHAMHTNASCISNNRHMQRTETKLFKYLSAEFRSNDSFKVAVPCKRFRKPKLAKYSSLARTNNDNLSTIVLLFMNLFSPLVFVNKSHAENRHSFIRMITYL